MFLAALMSRSWWVPHLGQSHWRMFNGFLPLLYPQVEQTWLDGYQRSMTVSWRPYHWALYSSIVRNCLQPVSSMLLLRPVFAACPLGR